MALLKSSFSELSTLRLAYRLVDDLFLPVFCVLGIQVISRLVSSLLLSGSQCRISFATPFISQFGSQDTEA